MLNASAYGIAKPAPSQPMPPVPLPFDVWGLDTMTRLPKTKNEKTNILTAIDYATR